MSEDKFYHDARQLVQWGRRNGLLYMPWDDIPQGKKQYLKPSERKVETFDDLFDDEEDV